MTPPATGRDIMLTLSRRDLFGSAVGFLANVTESQRPMARPRARPDFADLAARVVESRREVEAFNRTDSGLDADEEDEAGYALVRTADAVQGEMLAAMTRA